MNRNLFACSAAVAPSERWLEAFPGGMCTEAEAVLATGLPSDVIWVATAHADWPTLVARFHRTLPQSPLVVVTMVPEADEAIIALEHGARGYCHALAVPGLLREVELVARHGGLWVGAELMARVVEAAARVLAAPGRGPLPASLSARESEVARETAAGLSNKEIALKLGITERTVKAHLGAIFDKLGVRDRLQLVLRLSAHRSAALAD
ncbi:response regulator transcription factor [Azoarcus sp. PA01]|nr:response regulator transcription factor [Azoarcus sp. PA01]